MAGKGEWPTYSSNYPFDPNLLWLGARFAPAYLIIAPIFRLAGFSPEILCIIHVMCVTAPAILIFYTCLRLGVTEKIAIFWSLIYLFNLATVNMALFSIQEHTLIVPVTAIGLWALVANKFRIFLTCAIFIALLKDHMGLSMSGLGLLWWWYHKDWKKGAIIAISGIIILCTVLFFIKPMIVGENALGLFMDLEESKGDFEKQSFSRYSWMMLPWPEPVFVFFRLLVHEVNILYYIKILGPFLFMPLLSIMFILPASADLVANILSEHPSFKWLKFYYSSAAILTFVIASCAAMIFLSSISTRIKKVSLYLVIIIFIINVGYTVLHSNLHSRIEPVNNARNGKLQTMLSDEFNRTLKRLPEDIPLTAPIMIGTSFSKRKEIYPLSANVVRSNTIVFIAGRRFFRRIAARRLKEVLSDKNWGITYWDNPWVIMERWKEDSIDDVSLRQKLTDFYLRKDGDAGENTGIVY